MGPLKPYLAENISLQSSNCNILGLAARALWPFSLTKPDLLRFRCSSGRVLSKTKSVTPHFFDISDITNSSSFNGKIFRKKSRLENFRPNVLKVLLWSKNSLLFFFQILNACLFATSLASNFIYSKAVFFECKFRIAACKHSSLYMQNTRLKVWTLETPVLHVHTHCIFKLVSLWRPDLSRFQS